MKDIRQRIIKIARFIVLISLAIPATLSVYATSDISYVESVSNIVNIENPEFSDSTSKENNNNMVVCEIVEVLGEDTEDSEEYSLIFGKEIDEYEVKDKYSYIDILNTNEIVPFEGNKNKNNNNKRTATYSWVDQSDALIEIECPDETYCGAVVVLDEADRDLLERLVMGEAGHEGFEGAAMVAQAIRDAITYRGFNSVEEVRTALKYSGSISKEPNEDVKNAVAYIFDQGGCAVKHRIYYFYAYHKVTSTWHESQCFVAQVGNHRFFSTW